MDATGHHPDADHSRLGDAEGVVGKKQNPAWIDDHLATGLLELAASLLDPLLMLLQDSVDDVGAYVLGSGIGVLDLCDGIRQDVSAECHDDAVKRVAGRLGVADVPAADLADAGHANRDLNGVELLGERLETSDSVRFDAHTLFLELDRELGLLVRGC